MALAYNEHIRIPESLWQQLVYSLAMMSKSPNPQLRRAAAYTIVSLGNQSPNNEISAKIKRLEEALLEDVCYSVRNPLVKAAYREDSPPNTNLTAAA